jgi:hypothetical protein
VKYYKRDNRKQKSGLVDKNIEFFFQADLYAGALFITEATQFKGDAAIYVAILILLVRNMK